METTDELNLESYKKSHKDFEKFKKNLFNFLIKELPKEFILETLRKKKWIKRNWEEDHNKYIEVNKSNTLYD